MIFDYLFYQLVCGFQEPQEESFIWILYLDFRDSSCADSGYSSKPSNFLPFLLVCRVLFLYHLFDITCYKSFLANWSPCKAPCISLCSPKNESNPSLQRENVEKQCFQDTFSPFPLMCLRANASWNLFWDGMLANPEFWVLFSFFQKFLYSFHFFYLIWEAGLIWAHRVPLVSRGQEITVSSFVHNPAPSLWSPCLRGRDTAQRTQPGKCNSDLKLRRETNS